LQTAGSGTGTIQAYTDATRTATMGTVAAGYELAVTSNHSLAFRANNIVYWTIAATGALSNVIPTSSAAALTLAGAAFTTTSAIGNSGTAFTMDCSKSNVFTVTMTGNVAAGSLTISNIFDGQSVTLILTQDGTGSRTLGNPTGVKWPGGVPAAILSTAIGAIDMITFTRVSGTTYAVVMKAFA
jgi:hypothetical protein